MRGMYAFSESAGRWTSVPGRTAGQVPLQRLRVATYNVWFDPFEAERRCRAVLEILEREQPDVIALEEVTQPFLEAVLATDWIRSHYLVSRDRVDPAQRYDVVMLSRLPVRRFVAHELTSIMGRRLHMLEIDSSEGLVTVSGVHLESMREMAPTRLTQIEECLTIFNGARTAVWLGDFNAAPDSEEDQRIRVHFADAWNEAHLGPGYTRDTSQNAMLARIKDDRHQRIDRIFLRSDNFAPDAVRMLGTSPLEGTNGEVFPSDHFGLLAEFTLRRS